ncbi:glycosyltransferase [Pseudomonas sp. Hz4]
MKRLFKALPSRLGKKMEQRRWQAMLETSSLFNAPWYLAQNTDVALAGVDPLRHYLSIGWREMRDPCAEFDGIYYLTRYPDVAALDVPPLVHYWLHGRHEGRHLNPSLDLEWINAKHLAEQKTGDSPAPQNSQSSSTSAPYISVIIPTYNRLRLLPTVIEAWRIVDRHTNFPYEIIFSDDGSEDGSVEFLEQIFDLPIRVLKNDHGGASKARNAAIRAASGERLLIIGDDIFPAPDLLNVHARLAKRLGRNVATLGIVDWASDLTVNHLMEHITEIGNEQFSYNRLPDESFVDFRHFYTCNICIDRELVASQETIFDGRFDQYGFEDIELGYRLSLMGMKIYYSTSAKGDHYHPYVVEGFCKRQICSGRMAVVFRDAHPGVGRILGIDTLEVAFKKSKTERQSVNQAEWQARLDGLVDRCNYLEKLIQNGGKKGKKVLGAYLSFIYTTLFRAMYEYGVLQKIAGSDQVLSLAMSRHFGSVWDGYWELLKKNKVDSLDVEAGLTSNLLAAHISRDVSELVQPLEQRRAFDELEMLFAMSNQPTADNNKRVRLQQQAGRALYYLAKDPRYLFRRLHEAVKRRNAVSQAKVISLPASASRISLRLVVDRDGAQSQQIVERFKGIMGADTRVSWLERDGQLSAEQIGGEDPAQVFCYFWPSTIADFPHRDHLMGAWLALVENACDIALISYGLTNDGNVIYGDLRNQMVFSEAVRGSVLLQDLKDIEFCGKLYRTECKQVSAQNSSSISVLLNRDVVFNEYNSWFQTSQFKPRIVGLSAPSLTKTIKNRPIVFVFPVFVAVGGVERNTVEIIRRLKDSYDFVIVTMERLRHEQGSLASQFQDAGARMIEMSEIAPHSEYLRILLRLKNWLSPDLVWICNGSPWLCDNALNLRALFCDVPIIDQEVYDAKEGWINRYHEPGIRSFDRFIAVNQKIRQRFVGDLNLPANKVDLIYSAVDIQRIIDFKASRRSPESIRQKLGLPVSKKLFTFVGRLTGQKRPLEFLKIAQSRKDYVDECYVLVGDGELAKECVDFIRKEALDNVLRIPYVENTLELASVTEGLIITSAYEGLPIAMIEVLNFAVPVFATDTGDIQSVLEDFTGGCTVPVELYGEPRNIAYSEWLALLPNYRASLLGFEDAILQRFSSAQIAQQYVDCFNQASLAYVESAS